MLVMKSMNRVRESRLQALTHPALRWGYAAAWVLLITVLLLQPSGRPVVGPAAPPGPPDLGRELYLTTGHIIGFSVMTALIWWALAATLPSRRALHIAVLLALLLGIMTEWAQTLVVDRTASLFDLSVNIGVTLLTARLIDRLTH